MHSRVMVVSAPRAALVALAIIFFIISFGSDTFLFFQDSKTYDAYGGQISTSALQRYVSKIFNKYYLVLSCANLYLLFWLAKTYSYKLIWLLFNPYYLLLYFNYTKEQLFFFGLAASLYFLERLRQKNWFLLTPALLIFTLRPIYLPLLLIVFLRRIKSEKQIVMLGMIAALLIICVFHQDFDRYLVTFINQIYASANISHVGRDFFPNLCVPEKSSATTLIPCWFMTIIFLPIHEQIASYKFLIYAVFLAGFWWVLYLTTKLRRPWLYAIPCMLLLINLVTFWWGPVLGAALRYSAPVYWFALFLVLYDRRLSSLPRTAQMRMLRRLR